MYLFSYPSGWGWCRRHRDKVDALRGRRCRLLQVIVTLEKHTVIKHIITPQCMSMILRSEVVKKKSIKIHCWSIILPTQPDLERLVALLTPSVDLACLYLPPLQKYRGANNGLGPKHAVGRYRRTEHINKTDGGLDEL